MESNQYVAVREIIEQELIFSSAHDAYDQWFSALKIRINELLLADFNKIISILYRLDIDELRLAALLKVHPDIEAGQIIAELIVERQLEKIRSRQAYRQDDSSIDESEKW